jgi:flagellar hook-basal body complex protein FliE
MTSPIGDPAASARAAIEAALKRHTDAVARFKGVESGAAGDVARPDGFGEVLKNGLDGVNAPVQDTHQLVDEFLTGKVDDFHEVALRLKQSELSFRFVMEVRNKFVDAYREVMRMSV